MDQLSYGEFSADLHQRQGGQRSPMQVSIEVTRGEARPLLSELRGA